MVQKLVDAVDMIEATASTSLLAYFETNRTQLHSDMMSMLAPKLLHME